MDELLSHRDLLNMTTHIVGSHVAHNRIPARELPNLIQTVYESLCALRVMSPAQQANPQPAVPINKSVFPEYLICLEDGKKLKMLKRHLKSAYDMSPDEYRQKWGLSPDYPMVAPNYAAQRSQLAKKIGLGTQTPSEKIS